MEYHLCIICLVLGAFRSCDFLTKTKELSQKPSSNILHQFGMDSDVVITSNNLSACVPQLYLYLLKCKSRIISSCIIWKMGSHLKLYTNLNICESISIVALCISKIHLVSHTTNAQETRTEYTAHTDPWYAATPLTPLECSCFIVILARTISAPWGWHAICCRNMSEQ